MNRFPKISIITPVLNAFSTIEDTILSILDQRYPNLEYIIMDGGSDDGTIEVIKRYSHAINFWCSEVDEGQYAAINKGFLASNGEILFWLNAGDKLLPSSLLLVGEIFSNFKQVEWISSLSPGNFDANGFFFGLGAFPGFSKEGFLDGNNLPPLLSRASHIQQESTFWRRGLWEKAGSSIPNYSLAGDFALWAEFYKHADLIGVTYPLGGFRHLAGQRSEDHQLYFNQAHQSLIELRKCSGWVQSDSEKKSYLGQRIINNSYRSKGSHWSLQSCEFRL